MPARRGALLLMATGAALAGCAAKKPAAAPPPISVTVASPLVQKIVDWDDYVGRFEAVSQVEVRPRVTGYLQSVAFRDGQRIRAGQLLFVIDPRPYQAAYDQARAQVARAAATLANTRVELQRYQTLLAARAASQQEFETRFAAERQATADVAAAQAAARAAALNLGFTRVTAPISGRVSDRRVAPGNLVSADSTVLTTLVTLDPIRFTFSGSEGVYLKYERQDQAGARTSSRYAANPVEIRLQDEASYRWRGRMDFVDNALDVGSGTIRGRAVLPNPSGFLTPGMFGHMRLLGSGAYEGLLVPDEAVTTDQTRQVVYAVDGRGRVGQRLVEVGPLIGGLRVIRRGLGRDERVVIEGMQRVKAGAAVRAHTGRIQPPPPGEVPGVVEPAAASAKLAGPL